MKKVFFIASLFAATAVTAQTYEPLPDGDFEDWKTGKTYGTNGTDGDDYDELANPFWQTLNLISSLPPEMSTGPVVFWKTQGKSGYAPMAKSDTLWLGEQRIFLPGVWGAFTLDIPNTTAYFGRPFHSRPDSIVGYMKYHPVDGDSAYIFVDLYKKQGNVRKTIAKAEQYFYDSINEWTRFSIPFRYQGEEDPDSVTVLFIASGDIKNFTDLFHCDGQIGSTIWADECRFVYNNASAVENNAKAVNVVVYPNPTSDEIFVKLNTPVRGGVIEVFDIKGQIVTAKEFNGTNVSVSLRSLKPSIYMYRIVSDNKTLKSGRINLVK